MALAVAWDPLLKLINKKTVNPWILHQYYTYVGWQKWSKLCVSLYLDKQNQTQIHDNDTCTNICWYREDLYITAAVYVMSQCSRFCAPLFPVPSSWVQLATIPGVKSGSYASSCLRWIVWQDACILHKSLDLGPIKLDKYQLNHLEMNLDTLTMEKEALQWIPY